MAILEIDSSDISLHEAIDHLNEQLYRLLGNTRIHFSKRKKLLLQCERKNNQFRRSIDRADLVNEEKLIENSEIIRHIKMKIIDEDRQQGQRRKAEHEKHRYWSLDGRTATIGVIAAGVISLATFIIMMFDNSREKYLQISFNSFL